MIPEALASAAFLLVVAYLIVAQARTLQDTWAPPPPRTPRTPRARRR